MLADGFTISAEDGDGDAVSGGITVNVDVQDDIPVLLAEGGSDTVLVEEESVPDGQGGVIGNNEADGLSYTASGSIVDNVAWGADGFGKVTGLSDGSNSGVYDADAHTYTIETDRNNFV